MFLLPNFEPLIGRGVRYPDGSHRAERFSLIGGGWVFTLDEVDDAKGVVEALEVKFRVRCYPCRPAGEGGPKNFLR